MKTDVDPLHSFKQVPPQIEKELRNALNVRTFSEGESIFLQDASPQAVYLVASGRVKVVRITPEGYESILCVRGAGDYFCPVPLLDGYDHLGTAVAMTDVTLFWVERENFNTLCEKSPELLAIVQGDCLAEVRHLLHRLEAFAFRNVRERVTVTLLDEIRRQDSGNKPRNELHLTHQELAGLVGASRESVSRALNEMEREGLVSLGRGRISVQNSDSLQNTIGAKKTP